MTFEGDNMMGAKKKNRAAVLRLLHTNGNISRKHLAEEMHLTAAAITKIVAEMKNEGILIEGDAVATGNPGRREILLNINKEYAVALGVHINLRKVIVSAVNLEGEEIFAQTLDIVPAAPAEETMKTIAETIFRLLYKFSIDKNRIIGIGVAVRGHLSNDRRVSSDSYGALAEKNYPICDKLEELTGIPVTMENNVRALHAAQMFLSREVTGRTQIFLRCEYGIGASISIDGKIWNGVSQNSGEIGHILVDRKGGRLCSCGRIGCLETVASSRAIREILTEKLSAEETPVLWRLSQEKAAAEPGMQDILSAFEQNDPGVVKVVSRAAEELSVALESISRILDPDTIILYGSFFEDDRFIDMLLEKKAEYCSNVNMEKSKYNCTLENRAACILEVNKFFDNGGILDNE